MDSQKTNDARERILAAADQLFYSEGVRATGTEAIMARSGVAKATFYRHFPSKDALVLAYLDGRDKLFWGYLFSPRPPKDIEELMVRVDRLVNLPEITGCPFLRVASEYPDTDHPFHRRVIEHKEKFLGYFAELLANSASAKETAAKLLTVVDGALSMRLVFGPTRKAPLLLAAKAILHSTATRSGS